MTNPQIQYLQGAVATDWQLLWAYLRVLAMASAPPPISAATRSISASGFSWGPIMEPHLRRLAELSALKENWDSYGGRPPSTRSVQRARRFLLAVAAQYGDVYGSGACPFTIVPLAVGGVQIEWRGAGGDLELEFGPDNEIGFLLIRGQGDSRQFQEGDVDSETTALGLVGRALFPAAG